MASHWFRIFSQMFEEKGNESLGYQQTELFKRRYDRAIRESRYGESLDTNINVLWQTLFTPDWIKKAFAAVGKRNLEDRNTAAITFYYGPEEESRQDHYRFKPEKSEVVGVLVEQEGLGVEFYNNKGVNRACEKLQIVAKEVKENDGRIVFFSDMPPRVGEKAIIDIYSPQHVRVEEFKKQLKESASVWIGGVPDWVPRRYDMSVTEGVYIPDMREKEFTGFYKGPKGDYEQSKLVGILTEIKGVVNFRLAKCLWQKDEQVEIEAKNLAFKLDLGYDKPIDTL